MKICILSDSHAPLVDLLPNLADGETLLLNPGTVGGVRHAPATYLLGDLAELAFELRTLDKRLEQGMPATGT